MKQCCMPTDTTPTAKIDALDIVSLEPNRRFLGKLLVHLGFVSLLFAMFIWMHHSGVIKLSALLVRLDLRAFGGCLAGYRFEKQRFLL